MYSLLPLTLVKKPQPKTGTFLPFFIVLYEFINFVMLLSYPSISMFQNGSLRFIGIHGDPCLASALTRTRCQRAERGLRWREGVK